ncbi:hypothetical protein MIND_00239300 [Mycena indigotica]|uniref:Uncharacterized protein n=1 Tax=Mycena indigotica TaxID=2126181 RepID=A0A8H6T725_9AGAR|nr:uncharacterized protein MIND_00239300 [Mycena indigotica]KAF7312263.1 hypothetical protein MIND_00239300 [Mycena indigotica]
MQRTPRPHIDTQARPPQRQPSSPEWSGSIQVTPPPYTEDDDDLDPSQTPRPRTHSLNSQNAPLRAVSASVATMHMPFPEPQIYRSISASASNQSLGHRYTRSDQGQSPLRLQRDPSMTSVMTTTSAYYSNEDNDFYATASVDSHGDSAEETEDISRGFSQLSLQSEEGLRGFQSGKLAEKDEEWHKLVPPETLNMLGKREVQRQSVIFEVFKSEREYVADLEAIEQVCIRALRTASPPIIRESLLNKFVTEVFGNLAEITAHHQRMLAALFARQREQHPVVQSISDILLDTALKEDFRASYETYIKAYPLAESRHRKEIKQNTEYQAFIQSVSSDRRIRKRDLTTFLSRPVTRLPRLNLLLEQILKLTDDGHPDKEILPIILDILTSSVKSAQPGIEAAENKVKFFELIQSLVFQRGELIDMDLYADTRNLYRQAPVARWTRGEAGLSTWTNLCAALLDNYFILTNEETRPNGVIKRYLVSRPIPLSYLRLGSFNSPAETRRDGLKSRPVYPFVIYHAASKMRRYTLYVETEAERTKWHQVFQPALGLHQARQEANMATAKYFEPHVITDNFFRVPTVRVKASKPTGRVTSATPFTTGGRKFLAVGCFSGIFAGHWEEEKFYKALPSSNPTTLFALETISTRPFNRFVVQHDSTLMSYAQDLLGQVALAKLDPKKFQASCEKHDSSNVLFSRVMRVGKRVLIVYASRRMFQSSLDLHVLEAVDHTEAAISPKRSKGSSARYFRPFGDPGFVAKEAHDITPLVKTIAISTSDRIVILDPTNLTRSAITFVPDFDESNYTAAGAAMVALRKRLEETRPLGLLRCSSTELLVVYETMGCYVTRHGIPTRSSGFIRWESKATAFTSRGGHVLLFSPGFIEIRNVLTGLLEQVIEGQDIRLLHSSDDAILVAMRGKHDDEGGASEQIVDLRETTEISVPQAAMPVPSMWDEWDM